MKNFVFCLVAVAVCFLSATNAKAECPCGTNCPCGAAREVRVVVFQRVHVFGHGIAAGVVERVRNREFAPVRNTIAAIRNRGC